MMQTLEYGGSDISEGIDTNKTGSLCDCITCQY